MDDSDQYDDYNYDSYDYEPADDGNEGPDYYGDYENNDGYAEYREEGPQEHPSVQLDHSDSLVNAHEHVDVLAQALEVADALPPALAAIEPTTLLCKDHGVVLSKDCPKCSAVKVVLTPQQLADLGVRDPVVDPIPDAVSWLTGGVPVSEKKVTLILPEAAENYGHAVHFALPQPRGTFDTWIKEFLFLSFPQNQKLMQNLDVEKMILQFEGALSPHYITMLREVRNVMIKNLKNSRKTHRPLLLAIAKIDEVTRALRLHGANSGFEFPDEAPEKVVLGPKACIFTLMCGTFMLNTPCTYPHLIFK